MIGIALLALTPFIALDRGWDYWQLLTDGAEPPATVVKLEERSSRRGFLTNYYAVYDFTDAAGGQWSGRQQISDDLHSVLDTGNANRRIVIRYCRSKPGLSLISLRRLRNEFLTWAGIAVVVCTLIYTALVQQRRENSGIVATFRRRIEIDNSRQGSFRAGLTDATQTRRVGRS